MQNERERKRLVPIHRQSVMSASHDADCLVGPHGPSPIKKNKGISLMVFVLIYSAVESR